MLTIPEHIHKFKIYARAQYFHGQQIFPKIYWIFNTLTHCQLYWNSALERKILLKSNFHNYMLRLQLIQFHRKMLRLFGSWTMNNTAVLLIYTILWVYSNCEQTFKTGLLWLDCRTAQFIVIQIIYKALEVSSSAAFAFQCKCQS